MKTKAALLFLLLVTTATLTLTQISLVYAGTPAGTITYDAPSDTITVVGANSTHPCEFADIYAADVAGGWGQITKQGSQYTFNCRLVIGDGSTVTVFADKRVQIYFADASLASASQNEIEIKAAGDFSLGLLFDAAYHFTRGGCSLISGNTEASVRMINGLTGSYVYLYGCDMTTTSLHKRLIVAGTGRVWNCYLDTVALGDSSANCDVYNLDSMYADYAMFRCAGTTERVYIRGSSYDAFYSSSGVAFNVSDIDYAGPEVALIGSATSNYLINCKSANWTFTFAAAGTVYRQYTLELIVLNGDITDFVENANVTLTHDGAVFGSWLTNSSGQVEPQTLTYGFYNQTGDDTMYGGTPWTLSVTHSDWADYESKFYPVDKMKWTISMQSTSDADNNMLLIGLLTGTLAMVGFVVYVKR